MSLGAAEKLALSAAGGFLLVGMLTGVWKYRQMSIREDGRAHPYVDIAHRTALMYSFACLVLGGLVRFGDLSDAVAFAATGLPILFFAAAVASYVVHGVLEDTANQMSRPHRLGAIELPAAAIHGAMAVLIAGEIGGLAVLLWGFARAQLL